ncbi:hypothetical protein ASE04_09800 [Rhizobium sp. Root708]|uniref:hypothetical protein n=1 Tax=Rhizobium sp. Root708 TaxID=1736592 RepID=UPI0006F54377|nr:hypothetical protein [Rhizobium sp. Root708]KRB51814.1 hypothetical protein ASE04_09800 [Rhizobium sp. Root708]
MKRVFQLAGLIAMMIGLSLVAFASGRIGDASIVRFHEDWVYVGMAITVVGLALTFARAR